MPGLCSTGLPWWLSGKEICLPMQETWLWLLGLGRSLREGDGYPLHYSCLRNPMDRGAWWGFSPWGWKRVRYDLVTKQQQWCAQEVYRLFHVHNHSMKSELLFFFFFFYKHDKGTAFWWASNTCSIRMQGRGGSLPGITHCWILVSWVQAGCAW